MEKGILDKKILGLGVLGVAVVVCITFFMQNRPVITPVTPPPLPPQQQAPASGLTYKGESGKDALTILKEKATLKQDKAGLVISVNGRIADNNKSEYWAFYINGKSASVGPADYQTQDTDTIEWKIEKY